MARMTESKAGLPSPGLDAAREGRAFCLKVNAKTGINAEAVLTDSTFLKVVETGKRLVVTCFYMYLGTASDWVTAEFVVTANDDGSGAVTVLSPLFRVDTGTVASASLPTLVNICPPIVVTRVEGSHAFSARVQGNDASAALTLACNGWTEEDTDLN